MVDATPDFATQIADLASAAGRDGPELDGLILTHAHIGHYLGLALLGREAMSAQALPVYATASMRRFLESNRPWSHLIERGEVRLEPLGPGESLQFDGAEIHAFLSPHRGEDTDTIGVEVTGAQRTLLYVSDADVFPPALAERIHEADVALIDGTFYARDELPHREILEVRHPFVAESVERFGSAHGEIVFTHLNHTNALLGAEPPTLPAGFAIAREGDAFAL